MTHLILCREYPPAPYPAGGIGTYVQHMAGLLADAGETVHVIGQRSELAPEPLVSSHAGQLIVHRLSLDHPIACPPSNEAEQRTLLRQLANSTCPTQVFSWQAARYIERLVQSEPIDIIEAQEWEAPLYYLQVRRALGLGPNRRPPSIVHLHSPTQMIFEYNEWDQTLTDFLPLVRFEEHSIRAADALLCPSLYLARQVTDRFQLRPGSVKVIPYPMGVETPVLPRKAEVWARDSICYVGRLELRKGVVEWIEAAVLVASGHPGVSFDFFGSDTSIGGGAGRSVLATLQSRIPRDLRPRFRFHGSRSRAELMAALTQTAIAVVPSRWENFPFTCIEAMSTGLPVLASPNGGMAEMIVDNYSGWIARDGSAAGLAAALRRVLATPAETRATMGARAAAAIRVLCENSAIVDRHLAFCREVIAKVTRPTQVAQPDPPGPATRTFAEVSASVFRNAPAVGLLAPWTLHGETQLDPGPCSTPSSASANDPLPPGSIVRPEVLALEPHPTWATLREGHWGAFTYPGPPVVPRHAGVGSRRRYSGMALIANQSAHFAVQWFLGAPLDEKMRWIARVAARPGRLLQWFGWRVRGLTRHAAAGDAK